MKTTTAILSLLGTLATPAFAGFSVGVETASIPHLALHDEPPAKIVVRNDAETQASATIEFTLKNDEGEIGRAHV